MHLGKAPRRTPMRVTAVQSNGPLTNRLMEMGLIEGAQVEVVGTAPLGDPLQVRLGDYCLSLRRQDAELIDVAAGF